MTFGSWMWILRANISLKSVSQDRHSYMTFPGNHGKSRQITQWGHLTFTISWSVSSGLIAFLAHGPPATWTGHHFEARVCQMTHLFSHVACVANQIKVVGPHRAQICHVWPLLWENNVAHPAQHDSNQMVEPYMHKWFMGFHLRIHVHKTAIETPRALCLPACPLS